MFELSPRSTCHSRRCRAVAHLSVSPVRGNRCKILSKSVWRSPRTVRWLIQLLPARRRNLARLPKERPHTTPISTEKASDRIVMLWKFPYIDVNPASIEFIADCGRTVFAVGHSARIGLNPRACDRWFRKSPCPRVSLEVNARLARVYR